MPAYPTYRLEVELVSGTWTNLVADGDVIGSVRARYGIAGNGPMDCVASAGELAFMLKNGTNSSGGVRGYYSPFNTNVRSGWGYGIGCRLVILDAADSAASVTITRSGSTATVAWVGHGLSSDAWVLIAGATQTEYNGAQRITVTGANAFTYTVSGTPATPATGTITGIRAYVKFRGKIRVINPAAGIKRDQSVSVVAYDFMADLLEADVRELALEINATEAELIEAVIDAVATEAQPPFRDLDAGVDTYPYAFFNVADGDKAGGLIKDAALSAVGIAACKGDGTFIYRSRHTRSLVTSAFTLTDTMREFSAPSSLDKVFNRIRVTIHPQTIDAAATTVLFAQTGTAPSIGAGETLEVWGTYRDPSNTLKLVGGTAMVTPLVATTDYTGNASQDGSGADRTSDLSVVTSAFASTVKFEITNTSASAAYLTKLQIRGKGIYDNGPRTFESYTAQNYGDRPFSFDMPYQDDANTGQSAAEYLGGRYSDPTTLVDELAFVATDTAAFLTQALARDIGDAITVGETMTGITGVDALIQSVEITMLGRNMWCRWGLAPSTQIASWQLGIAGASELGATTVLGF